MGGDGGNLDDGAMPPMVDADPNRPDAISCVSADCPPPLECSPQTSTCEMPALFSVGGNASGVTGPMQLANNGGDGLSLDTSGSFQFMTGLASGASYSVTILSAPAGGSCVVNNGSGVVTDSDVTNVDVTCSTFVTDGIRCGGAVCNLATEQCCHEEIGAGGVCRLQGQGCSASQAEMECDDASDCSGADICCSFIDPGNQLKPATCRPACNMQGNQTPIILCAPVSPDTCPVGTCQYRADRDFYVCE